MVVEAYVTIHEQDLVIECERTGQFDTISHTYLFVGPRPVDRIPSDVKTVVARDHVPNYEHLPQFYDFTGWFVLAHHQLIEADQIVTLQYDMTIVDPEIGARCRHLLTAAPGPIAFTAGHRLADNWMLLLAGFEEWFRSGMREVNVDMDMWPDFNEWPSTQGTAWRTDDFCRYMAWFEPLFSTFAESVWAGHLAERTLKAWTVVADLPERYLGGVMSHRAADCHGTGALMAGRSDVYAARNAEFMAYQSS